MRLIKISKDKMFCLAIGFVGFCLLFFFPIISNADSLDNWLMRNPLPQTQGNYLSGVAFVNNIFVAVGGGGILLTSPDGTAWTVRTSGTSYGLSAVSYGNNAFVAVGAEGIILTSPEGISWTARTSGTSNFLYEVAYGNNTFVAVGSWGTILTSPDGMAWTVETSGTISDLVGVAYGNNTFVAVGNLGTMLTSLDGVTWTVRTSGTSSWLTGVAYGNNSFVAVGAGGKILTSPDGISWTTGTSGTSSWLTGIAYGNNAFVAVGGGEILTSPEGISWTARTSGTSNWLNGVVYGNNSFVAVGTYGTILQSESMGSQAQPPTVYSFLATSITSTGAILNGKLNPEGLSTTYYFDYGLTIDYGNKTPIAIGGYGSSEVAVSVELTGLTDGTSYHFRLVAKNSAGTTLGLDQTFSTLSSTSGSISGRVTVNFAGHNDLSVANASVYLQGTSYLTTTDSNGNFTLSNIPFGNYNLLITAPDLNSLTEAITLSEHSLQVAIPQMTLPQAGGIKCDVNDNGHLDLPDAIYILQVLSGIR
ncbi:MAG: carboxypeptidase regulatory-like domain-containing protein [Candidatus Tectomicrobia bacterium]|uniref:Carboxypeptidase regulatory-like domain-containing protein n=1 Tax=Tectimicrobiota bacterium TaxID=2528274 RepID=A0A933LPV3_UNCTE|nr:carboxypeptidase regulatory-like domain-containing protein [Candidatus Tectomicrobia bacterium]